MHWKKVVPASAADRSRLSGSSPGGQPAIGLDQRRFVRGQTGQQRDMRREYGAVVRLSKAVDNALKAMQGVPVRHQPQVVAERSVSGSH